MEKYNIKTINIDIPESKIYIRHSFFKEEDISKIVNHHSNNKTKYYVIINDVEVKINSKRLINIVNNIDNFNENFINYFFSLEKDVKSIKYHFNLYGVKQDGIIILITQNNIIKGDDVNVSRIHSRN